MKAIFISITLLIVAMIVIPVGGMSISNENRDFYMYGFLVCELLCIGSMLRFFINSRRK